MNFFYEYFFRTAFRLLFSLCSNKFIKSLAHAFSSPSPSPLASYRFSFHGGKNFISLNAK